MKKGFTLVEMMMAVSIFTVVMGMVFTTLKLNDIYRYNVGIQMGLYRQNKRAQDTIERELRLSAPDKFSLIDSDGDSAFDTIRFQIPLPTLDDEYNIRWGADSTEGYYIQYKLDNTYLKRQILDSGFSWVSERIIGADFDNLEFSSSGCPDNCIINITTRVLKKNPSDLWREFSLEVTSYVYVRNR